MLVEALEKKLLADQRRFPAHVNRASNLGEECERKLCYERTNWAAKALPSLRLQQRFAEGNEQERIVLRDLEAAGVKVYEQQTTLESREHKLSGHTDGTIYIDKEDGTKEGLVLEIKSCAPSMFDQLADIDDFQKYSWTRRYVSQLQLYIKLKGLKRGIFLVKSLDGRIREILVELDENHVQELFAKADRINEAVEAWEKAATPEEKEAVLLPRIQDNAKACLECPFTHVCNPKIQFDGMQVLDSEALAALLDQREALAEASSKYTRVCEEIKDRLGDRELVMVKDWIVSGKRDKRGFLRRTFERMSQVKEATQ